MTRRKIGSRRRGRDSFVDDKTDAALSSVKQLTDTVRTKVMRPIGARPLPPPHLVRNADLDPYIYEGIPWINRGRGILDPTPGNVQPLNRRLRREARASMGSPSRSSTFRTGARITYGDSPLAAMSWGEVSTRQGNIIAAEDSRQAVKKAETRVDAVLGKRPATMADAVSNLKRLETITNGGAPNGRNFLLELPYFEAQMQPELTTLSPRFAGGATQMSPYDYGIYYALAENMIDFPEAFENVHLVMAADNNPDIKGDDDGVGGSAMVFPIYVALKPQALEDRKVGDMGARSSLGIKDMSQVGVAFFGNDATASGGRIPAIILMPINRSPEQQKAKFTPTGFIAAFSTFLSQALGVQAQAPEISLPTPEDTVDRYLDMLRDWTRIFKKTGSVPKFLMDGVASNVIMGYLLEAEQLEERISQLKQVTGDGSSPGDSQMRLQMVRDLEDQLDKIHDEARQAYAHAVALHEVGHVLDQVGAYKSSSAYANATRAASFGLNSSIESSRDVVALRAFSAGVVHPATRDMTQAMSRKFMKDTLTGVLKNEDVRNRMPEMIDDIQKIVDALNVNHQSITQLVPGGATGDMIAWAEDLLNRDTATIDTSTASEIVRPIISGGWVPNVLIANPSRLASLADSSIDAIKALGAESELLKVKPLGITAYDLYKSNVERIIEPLEEKIARLPSPVGRALAKAVVSAVVHEAYVKMLQGAMESLAETHRDAEANAQSYSYLRSWINQQTIDMANFPFGGQRKLITDMSASNPGAVSEFMTLYGTTQGKPWFDDQGNFSDTKYLQYIFSDLTQPKGVDTMTAMKMVNSWFSESETNGWKGLPEDVIQLVRDAVPHITEYAGPADYNHVVPLPVGEFASNKETYAELHPIMLMKLENLMRLLSEQEREAVEKLHQAMIDAARGLIKSQYRPGGRP